MQPVFLVFRGQGGVPVKKLLKYYDNNSREWRY